MPIRTIRFIFIFTLVGHLHAFNYSENVKFRHFTVDLGLSSSRITCILQDHKGFIWLGTYDGLNQFDGYEFKIYRSQNNNPNSLSGNTIYDILEDQEGNLWIATIAGLDLFDRDRDCFIHFRKNDITADPYINNIFELDNGEIIVNSVETILKVDKKEIQLVEFRPQDLSLSDYHFSAISDILIDGKNRLWIASERDGLISFGLSTSKIHHYKFDKKSKNSLLANDIRCLMEDDDGSIWICTENGINVFNSQTNKFEFFKHDPQNSNSLSNNVCIYTIQDSKKNIWIATAQTGLNLWNKDTEKFIHFQYDKNNEFSLNDNSVQCIYEDRQGNLWIGTLKGISLLSINQHNFITYRNIPGNKNTLSNDMVMAFFADTDSLIWIGTDGGGLDLFDRRENIFSCFQNNSINTGKMPSNSILSILRDSQNNLWIGGYVAGLGLYNEKSNLFNHFLPDPSDSSSLSNNDVRCIYEDSKGNIWIATNGGGLNLLIDKDKNIFKHFKKNPNQPQNSLVNDFCLTIFEDSDSILWIGTYSGLTRFDLENNSMTNYKANITDSGSISNNWIYTIFEDSFQNLWIGTSNGLNLLDREKMTFKRYGTENGFLSDVINGILEDDHGNLWISTNYGITKFHPSTLKVKNYTMHDGLQSNEFYHGSYLKLSSGEMLFGGVNGFNIFHPDSIMEILNMPSVQMTGLKFFNKYIIAGIEDSPLKQHISETKQITLTHKQATIFSLEYTALDYLFSDKIQYQYRLEGYHDEWIYAGKDRSATFTNLSAGEYIFHVTCTNSDGIWNENDASLMIKILPSFWKSYWAFILYGLITILVIYLYHRYSMNVIKLKTDLQLQKIEKNKACELESMKSQFFTNISHEFRTPLTLILTPLKELIDSSQGKRWNLLKEEFLIMKKSAERLLRLVNQVIDLNKIEAKRLILNKKEFDIIAFTKSIVDTFKLIATENHVALKFYSQVESCYVLLDPDKIDIVIFNLLSNAFKFTPKNGEIKVTLLKPTSSTINILVEDTGPGIPEQHLEHIFERFYHLEHPSVHKRQGAGIGLSLCKELVELHEGKIFVKNKPIKGTCFCVHLLIGESLIHQKFVEANTIYEEYSDENNQKDVTLHKKKESNQSQILIVEDDDDLRRYLRRELKNLYYIWEASNGKQGLKKAKDRIPDLIISDIMMCEMDGIELTKQLKTNELTSHIPVILLTAHKADAQKLKGLETGADEYITKPFNLKMLKQKIQNLLEIRKILRKRFSKELRLEPKDITLTSQDEQFLIRAVELVEKYISEPKFDVETFSREMCMSRSQLLRKLKALTSESPTEFIKTIRLKRAAQLLENSQLTITEICYETGFNYPAHFSKLFNSKFGLTPKEYRKINANKN